MINGFIYKSVIGPIAIYEENGYIIEVEKNEKFRNDVKLNKTEVISQTINELEEYFLGQRKIFTVPLNPQTTIFRAKVLGELQKIPYGKTVSYQEIAIKIGNPRASRAVGGACHNNPISLLIPCHRVIATDGSMTGFGWGIDTKVFLLALEKKFTK